MFLATYHRFFKIVPLSAEIKLRVSAGVSPLKRREGEVHNLQQVVD